MPAPSLVRGAGLALLLAWPAVADAPAAFGTLEIELTHVEPLTGDLYVGLHSEPGNFPKVDKAARKETAKATSNPQTLVLEKVPYGTWAVSVWHDVNGDQKLQTGIFGIPKEPMGVSNNPRARMGPPRFDDAKFELKQERLKLSIHLDVP